MILLIRISFDLFQIKKMYIFSRIYSETRMRLRTFEAFFWEVLKKCKNSIRFNNKKNICMKFSVRGRIQISISSFKSNKIPCPLTLMNVVSTKYTMVHTFYFKSCPKIILWNTSELPICGACKELTQWSSFSPETCSQPCSVSSSCHHEEFINAS